MVFGFTSLLATFAFFSLPSFDKWIQSYNRSYETHQEYMFRQNIYLSNLVKISKHNSENYTWTMGVNNFTDLTSSEFKDYYAGCFHKRSEYETDKNIYKLLFFIVI